MSKRNNDEEVAMNPPVKKLHVDPIALKSKPTEFLKHDNKRLAQLLVQKNKLVVELSNKIIRLDQRFTEKDLVSAVIKAINRYWDRWDEDFRILLQKYDSESIHKFKIFQSRKEITDYADLKTFSQSLVDRQELSKQAVVKVIEAYEKQMEKKEKLSLALKGELELDEGKPQMCSVIKDINEQLCTENQNLKDLNTKLYAFYTNMAYECDYLKSATLNKEQELTIMRNKIKDLKNENKKIIEQNNELETQLAESLDKSKTMETVDETAQKQEKPNYEDTELDKLDMLVKKILILSNSPCIEKDSFGSDDDNVNTK